MLSGIGPASHLSSHSISVTVDLPGVGTHLMDHPVIDYHLRDKTQSMFAGMSHDPRRHGKISLPTTLQELALGIQYRLTGRGPLTSTVWHYVSEGLVCVRSPNRRLSKVLRSRVRRTRYSLRRRDSPFRHRTTSRTPRRAQMHQILSFGSRL